MAIATPKPKILHFVLVLLLAWYLPLHAETSESSFQYKVVSVLDGDTFIATDGNVTFRVRIAAMDAPEKGQPYAKMAKYRLQSMLKGNDVTINPIGKGVDQYGRTLGLVLFEGRDIAQEFIREGLALYYRPMCRDYPADKGKYNYDPKTYVAAEKDARRKKLNIWSHSFFQYPCKYRHNN